MPLESFATLPLICHPLLAPLTDDRQITPLPHLFIAVPNNF